MGDGRVEQDLIDFKSSVSKSLDAYSENLKMYIDSMEKLLNENEYFSLDNFIQLHQDRKNEAIRHFQSQSDDNELKFAIQNRLTTKIDEKLTIFEERNYEKRDKFVDFLVSHK